MAKEDLGGQKMKKKMNRLLALALSLILVVSLFPGVAHAEGTLLPAPVITVDENGVATWPAIEGADRYQYSISTAGGFLFTNACDIPAELARYDEESGTYTLTVWATDADKNQISEKASVEYSYTKPHEHEWATDWTYNNYRHWHACLNTPCSAAPLFCAEYGPHDFSDDGVCVCGKEGTPNSTYLVQVVGGKTEDGKTEYAPGETVTITADEPVPGKQFKEWTGVDGLTFTSGDKNSATAAFTMPAKDVRVDATYEDKIPDKYKVTVVGGNADKTEYAPGETVTITAYEPASDKQFAKWTTEDGVTFADATKATTTFVMPAKDVRVDATYEDEVPAGDLDDIPQTGDPMDLVLWGSLAMISAMAAAALIILQKKRVF